MSFINCHIEDELEDEYLNVNPTSLNFGSEQGKKDIIISSSSGQCNIFTTATWCYSLGGDRRIFDGKITIYADRNTSTSSRNATVVISEGKLQKSIDVYQEGITSLAAPKITKVLAGEWVPISIPFPLVYITWDTVLGATSYRVYRSNNASGTYIQIETEVMSSGVSSITVRDKNPLNGSNYYRVKAFAGSLESEFSDYGYVWINTP